MLIKLDPDFYTPESICNMARQFSDYMSVEFDANEEICLKMSVKAEHQPESVLIINTFLNNILELSIQDMMSNER
ncbi:hypothetical protein WC7_02410 [Citrobacter sp. KTE151]|nr:hypothetical protein WC7_02410 [Citrobacter sp. KTE151]